MHLVLAHKAVKEFKPELVIIDPISTLSAHGDAYGAKEMLARLLESMKTSGITVLATDLTVMDENMESTEVGISSICDTWIRLSMERQGHERQRRITIVKSRGMAHDYATKELLMTGKGMAIGDIRGNGEGK
jgi:circadian clock protein KaiC